MYGLTNPQHRLTSEGPRPRADCDVAKSSANRQRVIGWVVLVLIAPFALLDGSQWVSDKHLHTLLEVVATTTALFVGAIAYLRYRANRRQFELFVAAGFVGTALLDGYHAFVTSTWFDSVWASPSDTLIPWSWNASRIYLAILMAASVLACRRDMGDRRLEALGEGTVYAMVATLCLLTFAFFVLVPLPRAYHPELRLGRPEELVTALFFVCAIVGLYRDGRWRKHSFEYGLLLSVLIACICQALYMSRSYALFDAMFDAAHVLKIISYVVVLAGLIVSILGSYANEAAVTSKLKQTAAVVEYATDCILIMNANFVIEYVNPQFEREYGYSADEVIGKHVRNMNWALSDKQRYQDLREAMRRGDVWSGQLRSAARDGSSMEHDITASPILDKTGKVTHFVQIRRNITERLQMEQQLNQAQKLESIGQLAAGIAHEINTPTQYVGDNTRFVKDAFDDIGVLFDKLTELQASEEGTVSAQALGEALEQADVGYLREEIPRALAQSLEGVERVAKIVRAMKEFSHPAQEKTLVDLNSAIQSTLTVACNEWKYVAEIQTDFDAELPQVNCLPGEFNQVILNMVVNAAHAIADKLGESPSTKGVISVATGQVGDCVEISVSDTGCGMSEAVRARIFDPFFTTKEVGKGTGQGLNIAHDVVVNKHQGEIRVESEPGKGTCFTIRLPLDPQAMLSPLGPVKE